VSSAGDAEGACDVVGVIGAVPGVIGTLQAVEAVKLLTGKGIPLCGKILIYDALSACPFHVLNTRKDCNHLCATCGTTRSITKQSIAKYDYHAFVSSSSMGTTCSSQNDMNFSIVRATVEQLAEHLRTGQALVIDVRPENQFKISFLPGSMNFPYSQLNSYIEDIRVNISKSEKHGKRAFIICRRGNDSQKAVQALKQYGITRVLDVQGGLELWQSEIDRQFPLY